jgi:hypothetical protein
LAGSIQPRLLRPEWLIERGVTSFSATESEGIRVYLDSQSMGGIDALEIIDASIIEPVHFHSATQATARWGGGHREGVFQVITTG